MGLRLRAVRRLRRLHRWGAIQSNCVLGLAPGRARPSATDASRRVAIGAQFLFGREVGTTTFVHEIGHAQVRQHIECPARGASDPDLTYPHEGGGIGVWGFGVRDFQLRSPNNHSDYMSYCQPRWVSDWQWNATFLRIRELSEWEVSRTTSTSRRRMLVGAFNPQTGASSWWTENTPVPTDPEPFDWTFEFRGPDGRSWQRGAEVFAWNDGPWMTRARTRSCCMPEMVNAALHLPTPESAKQAQEALRLLKTGGRRSKLVRVLAGKEGHEVAVQVPREAFELFTQILEQMAGASGSRVGNAVALRGREGCRSVA